MFIGSLVIAVRIMINNIHVNPYLWHFHLSAVDSFHCIISFLSTIAYRNLWSCEFQMWNIRNGELPKKSFFPSTLSHYEVGSLSKVEPMTISQWHTQFKNKSMLKRSLIISFIQFVFVFYCTTMPFSYYYRT